MFRAPVSRIIVSRDTGTRGTSFRLAMQRMLSAARAIFIQFHTSRIITPVLLGGVIALFTLRASQGNYRADIFLRCHNLLNL